MRKTVVPLDLGEEELKQQPEVQTRIGGETEYFQVWEAEEEDTETTGEGGEKTREEERQISLIGCRIVGMKDNIMGMVVAEKAPGESCHRANSAS